jgi:hypothetical protein
LQAFSLARFSTKCNASKKIRNQGIRHSKFYTVLFAIKTYPSEGEPHHGTW